MNQLELDQLSDRILLKIRAKPGHKWSISRLAGSFKLSVDDILSGLQRLRDCGYKIRITSKTTAAYINSPDLLLPAEILYKLKAKRFGHKILAYKSVKSTNSIGAKLAHEGAAEGTLVIAEKQTGGRGRFGHKWHSEDKLGIYMSLIVKPKTTGEDISTLALVTAHAVACSINKLYKLKARIKWPNDILIGDKKVAGILVETAVSGKDVEYAVIGIGVNVNHTRDNFDSEVGTTATSLRVQLKRKQSRAELIRTVLYYLEKDYTIFQKSGFSSLRKKALSLSCLIGKKIKLKFGRKIIIGNVIDIDKNGSLVVDDGEKTEKYSAGEVTTRF